MKDRAALYLIKDAEEKGCWKKIVEYIILIEMNTVSCCYGLKIFFNLSLEFSQQLLLEYSFF